ncbi:hypothetical protein HYQ46_012264 [Verticillium longisporum]|nr:hypothetical protein HYQ46_012264 [Verticillium longisporum]
MNVRAAGVVEPLASISCGFVHTREPASKTACSSSREGGFFGSRYCRMKRVGDAARVGDGGAGELGLHNQVHVGAIVNLLFSGLRLGV